jgi:hypothetical protein
MTQEAATNPTESKKTTPGNTEKENKMNMGDRRIDPKMRLLLRLQKLATDRDQARASHRGSEVDGPWAEEGAKGQKNTRAIPQVIHYNALT